MSVCQTERREFSESLSLHFKKSNIHLTGKLSYVVRQSERYYNNRYNSM